MLSPTRKLVMACAVAAVLAAVAFTAWLFCFFLPMLSSSVSLPTGEEMDAAVRIVDAAGPIYEDAFGEGSRVHNVGVDFMRDSIDITVYGAVDEVLQNRLLKAMEEALPEKEPCRRPFRALFFDTNEDPRLIRLEPLSPSGRDSP